MIQWWIFHLFLGKYWHEPQESVFTQSKEHLHSKNSGIFLAHTPGGHCVWCPSEFCLFWGRQALGIRCSCDWQEYVKDEVLGHVATGLNPHFSDLGFTRKKLPFQLNPKSFQQPTWRLSLVCPTPPTCIQLPPFMAEGGVSSHLRVSVWKALLPSLSSLFQVFTQMWP